MVALEQIALGSGVFEQAIHVSIGDEVLASKGDSVGPRIRHASVSDQLLVQLFSNDIQQALQGVAIRTGFHLVVPDTARVSNPFRLTTTIEWLESSDGQRSVIRGAMPGIALPYFAANADEADDILSCELDDVSLTEIEETLCIGRCDLK